MTRLRVGRLTVTYKTDRSAVTSSIGHLTVGDKGKYSAVNERVSITRTLLALLVSASLVTGPVWAAPSSSLGIVVYADRALVGAGPASVGATVSAVTDSAPSSLVASRSVPAPRACFSLAQAAPRCPRMKSAQPRR